PINAQLLAEKAIALLDRPGAPAALVALAHELAELVQTRPDAGAIVSAACARRASLQEIVAELRRPRLIAERAPESAPASTGFAEAYPRIATLLAEHRARRQAAAIAGDALEGAIADLDE